MKSSANAGVRGANTPVNERVPGVGGPGNSVMGANTPAGGAGMNGKVRPTRKFPDTSAANAAPRGEGSPTGPGHIVRHTVRY